MLPAKDLLQPNYFLYSSFHLGPSTPLATWWHTSHLTWGNILLSQDLNPFQKPRHHGSPDLTYGDFIIVQSVWGMTQGVTMPLSGFLIRWTGARPAMFIGCAIFSLGTGLTYFTLEMVKELPQNFWQFWISRDSHGWLSRMGSSQPWARALLSFRQWPLAWDGFPTTRWRCLKFKS